MTLTYPNQILHYTASAPGYPGWAIRVGNFAFSDLGNGVSGSWGIFRLGLNPKSFTCSSAGGQYGRDGFKNETYTVYINRPVADYCQYKGPSCFLLDNTKIVPDLSVNYAGNPSTTDPWYHLVKFTQWIGASSSLVGNYNDSLTNQIDENATTINNTFRWYRDQLSLGDVQTYIGGTAGNRVLVNKFYPPIIANTASRIFDASYVASVPWIPGIISGKIYNLAGLTHATVTNGIIAKYWDYEGGYIGMTGSGGVTGLTISVDDGFAMSGPNPSSWNLNMYVMVSNAEANYDQFFIKYGFYDDLSLVHVGSIGVGFRNDSANIMLTLSYCNTLSTRVNTTITGSTFSLNRWIYISVRRLTDKLHFYINGKYLSQVSGFSFPAPLNTPVQAEVIYAGAGSNNAENKYKYLQYLSYYPTFQSDDDIRENFLRYALNSKIKNSNIRIALDTGTKTSHQGTTQWIDISGNELHGVTASFSWQGYKPAYTRKNFQITHASPLVDLFVNPFTISMWVLFEQLVDSNIFKKGRNKLTMLSGGSVQAEFGDGSLTRTYTTNSNLAAKKWYNITIAGINPNLVDIFIFSHTGTSQDGLPTITPGGSLVNVTIDDTSNIIIGDASENVYVASIVYWNTRFSQALCREFFSIQKGRFGMDSYAERISATNSVNCQPTTSTTTQPGAPPE